MVFCTFSLSATSERCAHPYQLRWLRDERLQHFGATLAEPALDFCVVTGLPVLQAPYAGARLRRGVSVKRRIKHTKRRHGRLRSAWRQLVSKSCYDSLNEWLLFSWHDADTRAPDLRRRLQIGSICGMRVLRNPPPKSGLHWRVGSNSRRFAEFQQIAAGCMFFTKFRRIL